MGGDDLFVVVLCVLFLGVTAFLLRGTRGVPPVEPTDERGETPRDAAPRAGRERRS